MLIGYCDYLGTQKKNSHRPIIVTSHNSTVIKWNLGTVIGLDFGLLCRRVIVIIYDNYCIGENVRNHSINYFYVNHLGLWSMTE